MFAGGRMHPVIGHSFQFTALHFGTAMDPFEFVRVAPHSSVFDHWLYAVPNITYLLVEIEAISGLCTELQWVISLWG